MLRPRGRRGVIDNSVKARTAFVGPTTIESLVIKGEGRRPFQIPLTNLTALHGEGPFVPPPGYERLRRAIGGGRVVVCSGPHGSGRDRAVTRALLSTGHTVIQMLPTGLTFSELGRAVSALADRADGCVLQVSDSAMLRGLSGSVGQPIRAIAAERDLAVVAITGPTTERPVERTTTVVTIERPPPQEIVRAWCEHRNAGLEASDLALDVVRCLASAMAPSDVAAIVEEVLRDPSRSTDAIAAIFDGAAAEASVSEWLGEGRSVREIGAMAAGVTLSGHATDIVHHHGESLARVLETGDPWTTQPTVLRASPSWPQGLLRIKDEQIGTHFGVHTMRVVEAAPPFKVQDLIRSTWEIFGPEFRIRYCRWLFELASHEHVRWDAAFTAGVLFSLDPVVIESQLLRPWALHQESRFRHCAGLALGAPIAIGRDPVAARRLARAWAFDENLRFQHTAAVAYGGLLGAWDPASSAPYQLVRLGERSPSLRVATDVSLVNLVVSGADAVAARSEVLGYLDLLARDRLEHERVFGILPLMTSALLRVELVCRESREALLDEPDNMAAYTSMVARALVTPSGASPGFAVVQSFMKAVARGRIDIELLETIIRKLREARRPSGDVPRLGAALRRVISAQKRSDDDEMRSVAVSLMDTFFG